MSKKELEGGNMKIGKFEKVLLLGCPWVFGIILIASGFFVSRVNVGFLSTLLICSGLICVSLYCVCVLLAKIVEK